MSFAFLNDDDHNNIGYVTFKIAHVIWIVHALNVDFHGKITTENLFLIVDRLSASTLHFFNNKQLKIRMNIP